MKKFIICLAILTCLTAYSSRARAQFVIAEVVKLVVKKVIKAIDLQVQRLQNETIWLQNAQKTLENQLSRFRLTEISDWSEKQRRLYDGYYKELQQVKAAIAYYQRIKPSACNKSRWYQNTGGPGTSFRLTAISSRQNWNKCKKSISDCLKPARKIWTSSCSSSIRARHK